ncbi:MAG TPA: hypothetical protein PLB62_05620 [Candidatus Sumerlaeota bacterium]|mgnify:CR=1 FL=1|nr:hypothetical protein [Candidatus Sumerlaeota bacterium]
MRVRLINMPVITAVIAATCLLLFPAAVSVARNGDASPHFRAVFPPEKEAAASFFLDMAEAARNRVEKTAGGPLDVEITIHWCPTEKDFFEKTSMHPEHIAAAASPYRRAIFLNGEKINVLSSREILPVMIHEYAHIYLALTLRDRLPRWLDEGLAMHLAGEWSMGRAISLTTSSVMGELIPITQMEGAFSGDKSVMNLAYLQSYSFTSHLIERVQGTNDLKGFLELLKDESARNRLLDDLDNRFILMGLEKSWKSSLGGRFRNTIFLFTSGSVMWFGLASLFIAAYVKKRKRMREQMERWEEEGDI